MAASLVWARQSVVLALTGLAVSVSPAQQPSQAQVEARAARMLASMVTDDARLELSLSDGYGPDLAPEKRAVAKSMLRALMSNERMPQYLAQVLAPVLSPTLTLKEARDYVLEGMAALQLQGLRRLPTERQAQYLQHVLALAKAVPPRTCKALFNGTVDTRTSGRIEQRYTASLPLGEFEAAIALNKDAAEAELAGYPDVKTISPMQAKGAERAYELAVAARVRRLPAELNAKVARNSATLDAAEACLFFRETMTAMLDLSEPYRGWYLTRFTESLQ